MACDVAFSWVGEFVVFLYILASSVSFATILLYVCPYVCHSISILRTIFLFGKCAPNNHGKYTLLQVPKRYFAHFYVAATIVPLMTIFLALNSGCKFLCKNFLWVYDFPDPILDKRGMVSVVSYMFLAVLTMALQHLVMRQLAHTRICASKAFKVISMLFPCFFLEMQNAYLVPKGYMFTYVTCPHFSLEITLYALTHAFLGLHLMPFTAVFLFVLSNQLCSGVVNHLWYLEHFPEFAQSRKIFIPFVF
ncbi:unnamed protein product [Taenia asiatica]|uniref:Polyprenal reductase n=1 Tax=Taenia asiatica TaxID=60517 RepID=A0A0R3WBM2_TAEAS|nr:unnamed protein product [Taenia asiatica]